MGLGLVKFGQDLVKAGQGMIQVWSVKSRFQPVLNLILTKLGLEFGRGQGRMR